MNDAIKQAIDALERVSAVDDDCDILSPSLAEAVSEALAALRAQPDHSEQHLGMVEGEK